MVAAAFALEAWSFSGLWSLVIGNSSFVIFGRQSPISQLEHPSHSLRQIERVSHDDQRYALFPVQLNEQVGEVLGRGAVESARRLVGQQQFGLIDQRADDGDTLAYQRGAFQRTTATCAADGSAVEIAAPKAGYQPWWTEFRITIVGVNQPRSVALGGTPVSDFNYDAKSKSLSVTVPAGKAASLSVQY